jgi:hypothetical protein
MADSLGLTENPAPPSSVVNDGTQSLFYTYTANFTTTPIKVRTEISILGGDPVAGTTQDTSIMGYPSPVVQTERYLIPSGLTPGNYSVTVYYYSQEFCPDAGCPSPQDDQDYEQWIQGQFIVAQATGTIVIHNFEDMSGSGIFQSLDPGVAGWGFQITAPNANYVGTNTYTATSDGSGNLTLAGVPAGPSAQYTISEIFPNPNPLDWSATAPTAQTFSLGTGQTKSLHFANVKPTSVCGTVYADQGHAGSFQSGQPGVGGVQVTLGGKTGLGAGASAQQTTDAQGNYCFSSLAPGAYSVKETSIPSPYTAETNVDGNTNGAGLISPITLTSGTPSGSNNFLVVGPTITPSCPAPGEVPPLCSPPTTTSTCPSYVSGLHLKLSSEVNGKSVKQKAKGTIAIAYGQRLSLQGVLLDAHGHAVSGACLSLYSAVDLPKAKQQLIGPLTTDSSGTVTYALPDGPSRMITLAYGALANDHVSSSVTVGVSPRLSFHVSYHSRSHKLLLGGTATTGSYSAVAYLQYFQGGKWQDVTRGKGVRMSVKVRGGAFSQPVPLVHQGAPYMFGPFLFRIHLSAQRGLPFTAAASNSVKVNYRVR